VTDFLRVLVPGQPPSSNHMYGVSYGGGRHKLPGIETYQASVTFLVREAMRRTGWKPPETGDIRVGYAYMLARSIDCTNAQKVIEDGVSEALCPGIRPPRCCRKYDERFLPYTVSRVIGVKDPHVVVYVGLQYFDEHP